MDRADDLALMSSGGKDSVAACMALAGTGRPRWLITTCGETDERVAIHGTRRGVIELQAEQLGAEPVIVPLPEACDNQTYRARVRAAVEPLIGQGLRRLAFGDLFLDDVRAFREAQCRDLGLRAEFPLWGQSTAKLAWRLADAGIDARICSVDAERVDPANLGRRWTPKWLETLGPGIDPCGENGEFHTLVVDAPVMHSPIDVVPGQVSISFGRFHMLDLRPL